MKFQHIKMPMVVNFDIIEPIPKASINNIISRFDIPRFIPKRIPYNNNCFNVLDEVALKDQYLFNKKLKTKPSVIAIEFDHTYHKPAKLLSMKKLEYSSIKASPPLMPYFKNCRKFPFILPMILYLVLVLVLVL